MDPSVYQDPQAAQEALNKLTPMMSLFYVAAGLALLMLIYALVRFAQGQRKLQQASGATARAAAGSPKARAKSGAGGASATTSGGKAKVDSADYAGLSKEEMRLIFEAEVKRRQEAGEEIAVRNVFEGPLDWDDVDEAGRPRVRAQKGPDYEEWLRQQADGKRGEGESEPAESA